MNEIQKIALVSRYIANGFNIAAAYVDVFESDNLDRGQIIARAKKLFRSDEFKEELFSQLDEVQNRLDDDEHYIKNIVHQTISNLMQLQKDDQKAAVRIEAAKETIAAIKAVQSLVENSGAKGNDGTTIEINF